MLAALGTHPLGREPLGEGPRMPQLAGFILGVRGAFDTNTPSFTFAEPLVVDLFAWGAGATGGAHATLMTGGGGPAGGYARLLANPGDALSWTMGIDTRGAIGSGGGVGGANGMDTVVTFGNRVMTAQGGRAGRVDGAGATRAFATGFDVNRYGGGSGERGEYGATPYSGMREAGTAAGFSDLFPGYQQVRGNQYTSDGSQGALYPAPPTSSGGGHGSGTDGNDGTWAGGGLLIALMYRV